ncbi:CD40 ligand [Notechis scutatus]|uniref:CD40 ligand n=1 Tax=Notechis scutatus TaxID=8663 RepID=A0A6J1VCW9_9SAUR|nr:CD40 ligand [Notechis scutatus]
MEEPRQQPYSPSEMPPAKPASRATIKTFLGVITIFVIAQMVVTILYILHLHLKVDKNWGNPKRGASIHLAGKSSQSKVLHWKNTTYAPKDDVFSNRDGKITISKGGRYYIYAQVTFCSKPQLPAPLIFKVHVYLDLPLETHQLLMKGVGTYNTAVDLCDLQSIHLSRAVELQSGHTIFVNVTDISRVDFNYGYTYFGLIQLS